MMTFIRILIGTVALIFVITKVFGQESGVSDEELFFPILNDRTEISAEVDTGANSPFLPDGTLRPEYNTPSTPAAQNTQQVERTSQPISANKNQYQDEDFSLIEDARDNSPYAAPEMGSSVKELLSETGEGVGISASPNAVSLPIGAMPRTKGGMENLRRENGNVSGVSGGGATGGVAPLNLMDKGRAGGMDAFAGRSTGTDTPTPVQGLMPTAENVSAQGEGDVSLSPVSKLEDKKPFAKDDVASFGLLDVTTGGFSFDLWKNTNRERVDEFLTLMEEKGVEAQGVESITLRKLLLSLMLTKAEPPVGDADMNWLSRRAQVLQSLGMAEAAGTLIEKSGVEYLGLEHFDGMPRLWVESAFLNGRYEDACQYVRGHLLNTDETFWRYALLTCQAVSGDKRGLGLSMDIMQESDMKDNSLLFKLLKAVREETETPRLSPKTRFSALQAAIYAENTRLLTPDVVFRLPDTILRKLMKDNSLAITYRLQAAERLVNDFGKAEDVAILSQLYDVIDFDQKMVKSASVIEQSKIEVDGSMARALLWQAMRYTDLPSTKALILRTLWERAEAEGLAKLPGALLPRMRGIQAEANLAWFSPYVIRAALQTGNVEEAKQWWMMLKNNKSLSKDLTLKRTSLALAFSLLDKKLDMDVLESWWKTQKEGVGDNLAHVERVLSLLEACEFSVPAVMWQDLHALASDSFAAQGHGPGPMWLRLLGTALENKEEGAALMLIMEPLLYAPAANISPQGIANIVTGLRFLGLEDEATGLVLETLLHGA